MILKFSSSAFLVLAFAFAYGINFASSDIPKTFSAENPEATRVRVEDVSPYSEVFLSDTKTSPAFDVGNGMVLRLEVEEPSNDDKAMNAARKAIGETPTVMESAKKKLAALLKNDSELNVPWQNDAWLVRFLRLRNYNVPKTYKLIRSYYYLKAKRSDLFGNLVPSDMRKVAEQGAMGVIPKRDPAGSRVILGLIKQWDPKKYPIQEMLRLALIFAETAAYEPATQLVGIQVVFDADGITWQQVKQISPSLAKFLVQWILTSAPIKIAGIHCLNESRLFWAMFNMFKPFLTEELRNKIHFHGSNLKSLHRYVPASALPDTYGGSFPKPNLTSFEWDVLLKSGDEELAKISSYGLKRAGKA